ncbi:MAG: hypothetical protein ACREP8_02255 [Candidatus Binatia bacterium]
MNIRCSVSLLFLALFLFVATEAPAASAWVLWVQEEQLSDPKGGNWGSQTRNWKVLDGSSSELECRQKLIERIKRATNPENPPKDEEVTHKVTGDTITFLFFPKGATSTEKVTRSQVLHYVCLPDTVDPREPKGSK